MMATKFTPGPWRVAMIQGDPAEPMVCTDGDVICLVEPNHEQPCATDLANFNLIAAAPELYEVCAAIEEHLRGGAKSYEEGQAIRARMNAALARARREA